MSFFMRYLCADAEALAQRCTVASDVAKNSINNFKTEAMFKFSTTLGAPTGLEASVLMLWVFQ